MSETDTDKGTRWRDEVTRALDTMRAGIICLTPENLGSQWLLFEAGALSKTREQKTRIWTFLLGVEPEHLKDPLAMFQATRADKEDIRKLVRSINNDLAAPVADKMLDSLFDRLWPELEKQLATILISSPAEGVTEEERMFSHMRHLIDSSGLPMYMTDRKFKVLHCNSHLEHLLDSSRSKLVDRPLADLISRFAERVPKRNRKRFEARQKQIVGRLLKDLAPHSEECEIIDNSKLAGNEYPGSYRVWISADKINLGDKIGDVGLFVLYRPEKM
jgi:PAS domain-containing protein